MHGLAGRYLRGQSSRDPTRASKGSTRMTDLDLTPEQPPPSAEMLAARQRRALAAGLGGGREREGVGAKASFAERRMRASDTAPVAALHELSGATRAAAACHAARALPEAHVLRGAAVDAAGRARPAVGAQPQPDDALVVPAGTLVRGYLRCRALLLAGDIIGNVHCTAGPVVIRPGASLKGRLVAAGDVYVSGAVGDSGGGAVITARGKLTLAPGARVDGDVRSGGLDLHDGAVLHGVARASED
jgi:cytoskeletal protein CcmA (bactofilin family)